MGKLTGQRFGFMLFEGWADRISDLLATSQNHRYKHDSRADNDQADDCQ